MKNSHKLRTWRNKIGRDTKIQENRTQLSDSLLTYSVLPFVAANNLANAFQKKQKRMSGRHKDYVTKYIRKQGYADYNFVQVVQPLNLVILESKNARARLKELSKTVRLAYEKGLKIKAVGTGHSYSDIMTTNDNLMLTEELKEVLKNSGSKNGSVILHDQYLDTDAPLVRDILNSRNATGKKDQRFFYEFESGIKIYELNEALEKDKLGLYNMGTYQGQSFIGAASTGTHGSGIGIGSLPEMILSMCIVTEGGLIFRIESKTNRITKKGSKLSSIPKVGDNEFPEEAKKSLEELRKDGDLTRSPEGRDVFLIQNDDWFNAAKLNIGTFGIVYSLIIEVGKAYDLVETVEFITWEDLKVRLNKPIGSPEYEDLFVSKNITGLMGDDILDVIEKINGNHAIRHTEILVNPYPDGKKPGKRSNKHYCRILRRYASYDLEDFGICQKRNRVPGDIPATVVRGIANSKAEGATVQKNKQVHFFLNNNVIFRVAKSAGDIHWNNRTENLMDLARSQKGFTPSDHLDKHGSEPNYFRSYNKKFHYRNRSWKVFPAGGDKIGGYGAEMALPFAKESPGEDRKFIKAVDRLLEIAALTLEEGGQAQTVPYSLRFVSGSKTHMSPQYHENADPGNPETATCMIELLNLYDTVGGKELLRRYQLAMLEMEGRPHWGLDMNVMSGFYLEKNMYPEFPKWKKAYDVFNAFGTFNNPFTHRMGWSIKDH